MKIKQTIPALLTAAGLAMAAPFAAAQSTPASEQAPAAQQAPAAPTAPAPDAATVSKFVAAYTEIQDIQESYSEKLQSVSDTDKAMELQQEAQQKMHNAVTSNGLDVEEYSQVANQVNSDQDLRARVTREIQEASDS